MNILVYGRLRSTRNPQYPLQDVVIAEVFWWSSIDERINGTLNLAADLFGRGVLFVSRVSTRLWVFRVTLMPCCPGSICVHMTCRSTHRHLNIEPSHDSIKASRQVYSPLYSEAKLPTSSLRSSSSVLSTFAKPFANMDIATVCVSSALKSAPSNP